MKKSVNRDISLIITEKCNLKCIYCYEKSKSSSNMSFETAKKIIDHELNENKHYSSYTIDFFGGEPFCNFELIKQIYNYVMDVYNEKAIHFFATTNGTLIHGQIQQWLYERRANFTLGLSLDGTPVAHNINRSNSFELIDLDFFLKTYPQQNIKMTVSEESLPYLAESVIYATELGFIVSCNLAYMVDWLEESNKKILEQQLEKLIDFYIKNPQYEVCSMLDNKIEILAIPSSEKNTITKTCGTGTTMSCYSIEGEEYPCQLFAPISAGKNAKKTADLNITETISIDDLDDRCKKCYYRRICSICLGSNYLSTLSLYKVDASRCELQKIIYKATSKLKALQWKNGQLNYSKNDEQALIRSIVYIQKNL